MLAKKNRILLNKEFDQIFKTGQSFYGQVLGAKVVDGNFPETRVGILVGLKVSKLAVVRNKIKRQLREIIRQELPLLKKSKDLVIITLPTITKADFNQLAKEVQMVFKKLDLYQ
ncbi:MAG: ribonuclease P protein component [Patescibacteria group bacterium]|jgi:ribonuclease P protein component